VLDEEVAQSLIGLRKELPRLPIKGLIEELRSRKVIDPWVRICPTTVYRFLKAQGYWIQLKLPQKTKALEAELPNDLWQSDMMFGPGVLVGDRQRKDVSFCFFSMI